MRNAQGYATVVGGPSHTADGQPAGPPGLVTDGECDTFTCGHCQRLTHVLPLMDAADLGGLCKCCMRLICGKCVDKGLCTPWEVMIERMEDKQRFAREIDAA